MKLKLGYMASGHETDSSYLTAPGASLTTTGYTSITELRIQTQNSCTSRKHTTNSYEPEQSMQEVQAENY